MRMVNILLIDQNDLIRSGIKYIIRGVKNLQIIHESVDCKEAIAVANDIQPDIAIICFNKFEIDAQNEDTENLSHY
jgi:YesN/AraC family two-component response regulator